MVDVRWRAVSGVDLVCWEGDEEYLIYHSGSTDTHLLVPDAAIVLAELKDRSCTASELSLKLKDRLSIDKTSVNSILRQLKKMLLIEACSK